MSVMPICAMIDPSFSSTIECTIDCGCTSTSICDEGTPNSQCASITSRPLFISVAESIVIFGPICHVGCFSASAAVTFASAASDRPRNGPPDAVRISRRSSPAAAAVQALMDGVVLAVDGQHRHAFAARRIHHDAAGHDQHFLVGERDRLAGLDRASTASSAAVPDEAHSTMSTSGCVAISHRPSLPTPEISAGDPPSAARSLSIASPVAIATARGRNSRICFTIARDVGRRRDRDDLDAIGDASAPRPARWCRSIPSSREWRCASRTGSTGSKDSRSSKGQSF